MPIAPMISGSTATTSLGLPRVVAPAQAAALPSMRNPADRPFLAKPGAPLCGPRSTGGPSPWHSACIALGRVPRDAGAGRGTPAYREGEREPINREPGERACQQCQEVSTEGTFRADYATLNNSGDGEQT